MPHKAFSGLYSLPMPWPLFGLVALSCLLLPKSVPCLCTCFPSAACLGQGNLAFIGDGSTSLEKEFPSALPHWQPIPLKSPLAPLFSDCHNDGRLSTHQPTSCVRGARGNSWRLTKLPVLVEVAVTPSESCPRALCWPLPVPGTSLEMLIINYH